MISLYADETGESDDTKDAFEVPNNPEPAPMLEPQPMPKKNVTIYNIERIAAALGVEAYELLITK